MIASVDPLRPMDWMALGSAITIAIGLLYRWLLGSTHHRDRRPINELDGIPPMRQRP